MPECVETIAYSFPRLHVVALPPAHPLTLLSRWRCTPSLPAHSSLFPSWHFYFICSLCTSLCLRYKAWSLRSPSYMSGGKGKGAELESLHTRTTPEQSGGRTLQNVCVRAARCCLARGACGLLVPGVIRQSILRTRQPFGTLPLCANRTREFLVHEIHSTALFVRETSEHLSACVLLAFQDGVSWQDVDCRVPPIRGFSACILNSSSFR
jgi:hypothetical protein